MRSELVFAAESTLPSRYVLCRVLSAATRKFHRPSTRIEDTTDEVLRYIAKSEVATVIPGKSTMSEVSGCSL